MRDQRIEQEAVAVVGARAAPWAGVAWRLAVALLGAGALVAHAQTDQTVPITQEPSHHLALTTDYVRVFDVTAAPHATTLIHRHDHDYVFVTLGDADITSTRTDGSPPARLVLKDGAIEYARGAFAHSVANRLDRPFHNITIELLHPTTGAATCTTACDRSPPCSNAGHCPSITRKSSADQWVADAVTLPPGATWSPDSATAPQLAVVVSTSDLEVRGEFESTADLHRTSGNLIWMPVHTNRRVLPGGAIMQRLKPGLTNVGHASARVVVLEWKRS